MAPNICPSPRPRCARRSGSSLSSAISAGTVQAGRGGVSDCAGSVAGVTVSLPAASGHWDVARETSSFRVPETDRGDGDIWGGTRGGCGCVISGTFRQKGGVPPHAGRVREVSMAADGAGVASGSPTIDVSSVTTDRGPEVTPWDGPTPAADAARCRQHGEPCPRSRAGGLPGWVRTAAGHLQRCAP